MLASLKGYIVTAAVALLVGVGGGIAFGWNHWRPTPIVETPAVSVRQSDSSLVLQRAPDAHAKPAQVIPKGAMVERVVHVEVQPKAPEPSSIVQASPMPVGGSPTSKIPSEAGPPSVDMAPLGKQIVPVFCPSVGIDLTLIRLKDGTQRVIASSKDGAVLDSLSVDHPVVDVAPARPLVWSAGPIWGGGDNGVGVNLTRDLGPLRLVGAVLRAPARGPLPVRAVGLLAANIRF